MIPRLLDREFALGLRERGRRMIGEDAEGKRPVDDGAPKGIAATKDGGYVEFFEKHDLPSRQDDTILGVARSRQIGQNAARLLGRDSSIKILYDQFAIKRQQSIGGKATDPHQDGVVLPFDRPSVGFWIALGDLVPEQGLMSFRSGSSTLGPLGRRVFASEEELEREWPRVKKFPRSTPVPMQAGDASVHGSWTLHSAGPNVTDQPRWSLMLILFPGDAIHAQVHRTTEPLDLPLRRPLEHPNFQVIYDPQAHLPPIG